MSKKSRVRGPRRERLRAWRLLSYAFWLAVGLALLLFVLHHFRPYPPGRSLDPGLPESRVLAVIIAGALFFALGSIVLEEIKRNARRLSGAGDPEPKRYEDRDEFPDSEQPPGFISNKEAMRRLLAGRPVLLDLDPDAGPVVVQAVPRCETCQWWERQGGPGPREGICRRTHDSSGLTHGSKAVAVDNTAAGLFANLFTAPAFGCVQWERRTESPNAGRGP